MYNNIITDYQHLMFLNVEGEMTLTPTNLAHSQYTWQPDVPLEQIAVSLELRNGRTAHALLF